MKNKKIILAALLSSLGMSSSFAATASNNFDASATIENFCSISVDDVNFGVVSAPLSAQGTTSNMTILCSNNTQYTIDLSYAGTRPSDSSSETYSFITQSHNAPTSENAYKIKNSSGVTLSGSYDDFSCKASELNKIYLWNRNASQLLYGNSTTGWVNDTHGICEPGTYEVNAQNFKNAFGGSNQFGIMHGASKGDRLAFKITIPDDNTKIWNHGQHSVQGTGNGESQIIPLNAQIDPNNSSSQYLAQDSYSTTVTATIQY